MSTSTLNRTARLLTFCLIVFLNIPNSECLAQSGIRWRSDTLSVCFVSDTQEPMLVERVTLAYNGNAKARKAIFQKVLALKPNAVVHLGDEVSLGTDDLSWKDVDEFVKKLHDGGISFSPIPGNHEYLMSSRAGISRFTSRYPEVNLDGYAKRCGNVAVVLVNSNFTELTAKERERQLSWYKKTLADFESDPAIDFVIVGCHHPPFTNSKIVGVSKGIRDNFLPDFYKSEKCKLFLSGHCHAFEHFRVNGKDFLVIGGGGGIQQPLKTGEKAEYHDLFSTTLEKRMFHFLSVKSWDDTLSVNLMMLRDDFKTFDNLPQLIFVREKPPEGKSME